MATLSRTPRRAVLTAHIVVSVGLLGDSAGLLAVALQAASTDDPAVAAGVARHDGALQHVLRDPAQRAVDPHRRRAGRHLEVGRVPRRRG